MFSCLRRIQEIFQGGAPKFAIFSSRVYLSILRMKKTLEGSGDMLPLKIFGNVRSIAAIFALFEQFLGKFC